MWRSVKIENFRRFERFELDGLGRVNLLVGMNNCGKTSVLEAVHLLSSRLDLEPLYTMMLRRGEYALNGDLEINVGHVFFGGAIGEGSHLEISGVRSDVERVEEWTRASITKIDEDRKEASDLSLTDVLGLSISWGGVDGRKVTLPLSGSGGLPLQPPRKALGRKDSAVNFIESFTLSTDDIVTLLDSVILTVDEPLVLDALRIIDPSIERLASISGYRENRWMEKMIRRYGLPPRGGIMVSRKGYDRAPIGTMGEGILRLLGLALVLVNNRNGTVLVDDIDTGLHYSVMSDMWRLVYETASRLNVQVFATTHNSDCWTSLAPLLDNGETSVDVSIQRIETDKSQAVAFSSEEIAIAAERGIEVR